MMPDSGGNEWNDTQTPRQLLSAAVANPLSNENHLLAVLSLPVQERASVHSHLIERMTDRLEKTEITEFPYHEHVMKQLKKNVSDPVSLIGKVSVDWPVVEASFESKKLWQQMDPHFGRPKTDKATLSAPVIHKDDHLSALLQEASEMEQGKSSHAPALFQLPKKAPFGPPSTHSISAFQKPITAAVGGMVASHPDEEIPTNEFVSARQQLAINTAQKQSSKYMAYKPPPSRPLTAYQKRVKKAQEEVDQEPIMELKPKLAMAKKQKFVPVNEDEEEEVKDVYNLRAGAIKTVTRRKPMKQTANEPDPDVPEVLRNIDPHMIEIIKNEILEKSPAVKWEDIAGLQHAKKTITEIVIWPMQRPDLFQGLRGPPKGVLLFGPPGTGKTLIGKCIASEACATFFSISASSLTSKWVGDGEKMVRALFTVARHEQPSVIFIDEIDSLLTQRTGDENEANRRLKTEFLVQFDGAATDSKDRVLVLGATNRPHELDEAARRRLVKRLYIPLPDLEARRQLLETLLKQQKHDLNSEQIQWMAEKTEGYSGADVHQLCCEAALGPLRCLTDIRHVSVDEVRPVQLHDFEEALTQVRASVSQKDLSLYEQWNRDFGSLGK